MKSFVRSYVQTCILVTALILEGCSSFSTMEEAGDDALFRNSTPDRPIPAEIAQDLTSLNREGFKQLQADYAQHARDAVKRDPAYASSAPAGQANPPTAPMGPVATAASPTPLSGASPGPESIVKASPEPGVETATVAAAQASSSQKTTATPERHLASRGSFKGKKSSASGGPYVVKRGDTLMKIAFETFGDLERWKELYNSNKAKIGSYHILRAGMVLTLPDREFVLIERNGTPYLIKQRDTLSKISYGVYGSESKWRLIWHNNPQLIHDPNKIYAGFTLYYTPLESPQSAPSNSTRAPAESH